MDQKTRQGSQTSMAFPSRQRIEAERDISRLNGSLERPKRRISFIHPRQVPRWVPPSRRNLPRMDEGNPALRALQTRSEEHTSELQSLAYLVCRLLLEKKKK